MVKYIFTKENKKLQDYLSKKCNISPITAQILINRGHEDPEEIEKFLNISLDSLTHPYKMLNLEKACTRIVNSIIKKEKIAIFGDYDVDGITSSAILINFFKEIGYNNLIWHIPSRDEGYGLNKEIIKKFKDKDTKLIITVDCGIQNFREVDYANSLGIDVIITDHHEPSEILPGAFAVINPKQKDCKFPFKELAGVGIAFYLIMGLRIKLREKGIIKNNLNLLKYLDLVAIGTIADICPLVKENRIFVKFGLNQIKNSNRAGIKALRQLCYLENKNINYWDVGFRIAPRLNAAGRISNPMKALTLLITDQYHEALKITDELNKNNYERQKIEEKILSEAIKLIEKDDKLKSRKSIVLYSDSWHEGVIGIVSSKLVEKYYKPTILISFSGDYGKGSARSIKDFDIFNGIKMCEELLESFGGHKLAGGLMIKREKIAEFIDAFESIVNRLTTKDHFIKKIFIDKIVDFKEINNDLIKELIKLSPFGPSNEEPLLFANDILVSEIKGFGMNHLQLQVEKNNIAFEAVGFNIANKNIELGDSVNIAFMPYFENQKIKLKIKFIEKIQ